MALLDISHRFQFRRWQAGGFVFEELSGELGEPGKVVTHRLVGAQREVSEGTGEHAGHRIAIRFGAPGDARNLSLQNPNMNTFAPRALQDTFQGSGGSYYKLECEWAAKLHQGYKIHATVRDKYRTGEDRPISREVQWVEITPAGRKNSLPPLIFGNFSSPQSRAATGH